MILRSPDGGVLFVTATPIRPIRQRVDIAHAMKMTTADLSRLVWEIALIPEASPWLLLGARSTASRVKNLVQARPDLSRVVLVGNKVSAAFGLIEHRLFDIKDTDFHPAVSLVTSHDWNLTQMRCRNFWQDLGDEIRSNQIAASAREQCAKARAQLRRWG